MQLAFGIAGAALGSFVPVIGWQMGWSLGMMVGGMVEGSKTQELDKQFGPRLGDLKVQTSTYGNMIPRVYGTVRIAGNMFWLRAGHIDEVTTVTVQESGGKGGGGGTSQEQESYSYFATFAVSLCEGRGGAKGIRKVWANGKMIIDNSSNFAMMSIPGGGSALFYPGSETQGIDGTMDLDHPGLTPAYRGTSYLLFTDLPLATSGNRIANLEAELVMDGTDAFMVPEPHYDLVTGEKFSNVHTGPGYVARVTPSAQYLWAVSEEEDFSAGEFELIVPGGVDVDVSSLALAEFAANLSDIVDLTVRVTAPVTHLIAGTGWGSFPNLASMLFVFQSTVAGHGGVAGGVTGITPEDGDDGGNAFDLQGLSIDIDNSAGFIFGGGGGGGAGGIAFSSDNVAPTPDQITATAFGGTGGGGAGGLATAAGDFDAGAAIEKSFISTNPPSVNITDLTGTLVSTGANPQTINCTQLATQGEDGGISGSTAIIGAGGDPTLCDGTTGLVAQGGAGGAGGDFGADGEDGLAATATATTSTFVVAPGDGGVAGKAINLGGGTANFLSGNTGARVKGVVS